MTSLQFQSRRSAIAITLLLTTLGCSQQINPPSPSPQRAIAVVAGSSHFLFRPTQAKSRGWIVILPGTDGLKMTSLKDETHYERVAERLNRAGFDALLIDYRPAWREAPDRPEGIAGDRIAWVAARAIRWMKLKHPSTQQRSGVVIGWSKGGEGVTSLLQNSQQCHELKIAAGAMYYPSNEENRTLSSAIPLLILTGEDDDVTPIDAARSLGQSSATKFIELNGAGHGFDILSLKEPMTMRFPPIVGRKYSFAYNASAAQSAEAALDNFLARHVPAD